MPPLETDNSEEDTEDVPPPYTDDSEEDTGYGENEDGDDQERHGSLESISGNHNWEAENNKTTSRTASPNTMEQPGLRPHLSQEGCEDDRRCLERQPGVPQNISKDDRRCREERQPRTLQNSNKAENQHTMIQKVLEWIETQNSNNDQRCREERQPRTLQNSNKAGNQHTVLQRGPGERTQETNRQTEVCRHFLRDDCVHGLSGKRPFGERKECNFDHPALCWRYLRGYLRYGLGTEGCKSTKICGRTQPRI